MFNLTFALGLYSPNDALCAVTLDDSDTYYAFVCVRIAHVI